MNLTQTIFIDNLNKASPNKNVQALLSEILQFKGKRQLGSEIGTLIYCIEKIYLVQE